MPDDAMRTYEAAVELNPADQAAMQRAAEFFNLPMRTLLIWCLKHGIDWAKDFADLSKIDGTAPPQAGRTYSATIELDDKGDAELAELAEHSGVSKDDVLREAIMEGLMILKVHRLADLEDDAAPQGDRSTKLDDDIPF